MSFLTYPIYARQTRAPAIALSPLAQAQVWGLALAMNALGEKFKTVVDVTLVYPEGAPRFWDFMRLGARTA